MPTVYKCLLNRGAKARSFALPHQLAFYPCPKRQHRGGSGRTFAKGTLWEPTFPVPLRDVEVFHLSGNAVIPVGLATWQELQEKGTYKSTGGEEGWKGWQAAGTGGQTPCLGYGSVFLR